MVLQLDVMQTMTPLDFMDFRDFLYPASGFQSYQFRLIENKLGMKSERRVELEKKSYHERLSCPHASMVITAEAGPNLFDALEKWLERTPFLKHESFDFLQSYKAGNYVNMLDMTYYDLTGVNCNALFTCLCAFASVLMICISC